MDEDTSSDTIAEFRQKRGSLSTHFRFTPAGLIYRFEQKNDVASERHVALDTVSPPSHYVRGVQADNAARFIIFLVAGLSLFGVSRQEALSPLVTLLFVTTVLLATFAGALLIARLRRVAYTSIPAGDEGIVVIADEQHDEIVARIEAGRRAALRPLAAPEPETTVRHHLRTLRWLTATGVITEPERAELTASIGAEDPLPPRSDTPTMPPRTFHQRRLGLTIDVELFADHFTYRHALLLGGEIAFSRIYQELDERQMITRERAQVPLLVLGIGLLGGVVLSAFAAVNQAHPPGYYVGGAGLGRAMADTGPLMLLLFIGIGLIAVLFQHRLIGPWPGVQLLRGNEGEAIVAAIEAQRLNDLRSLAELDPLRTIDEHAQLLEQLLADGAIDPAERDRSLAAAQAAGDHEALDRLIDEPAPDEAHQPQRMLH